MSNNNAGRAAKTGLALFTNKNKKIDKHPDFRGELYVTRESLRSWVDALNGGDTVKLRVACWKKTTAGGEGFLSGSINVDNGPPAPQQKKQRDNSFDDAI